MAAITLPVIGYALDAADRISEVSSDWAEFAAANSAPELTPGYVLRRSVYDFIAGDDVRSYYRTLFGRLRQSGIPVSLSFRCDSPVLRRYTAMQLAARPDQSIEVTCTMTRVEPREKIPLFERRAHRSDSSVFVCSSCGMVRIGTGKWLEAELAVAKLRLTNRDAQPVLRYTFCESCPNAHPVTVI